jgi:hypothetical protein
VLVIFYPPTWPLVLLALGSYPKNDETDLPNVEDLSRFPGLRGLDLKQPPAWALARDPNARDTARRLTTAPSDQAIGTLRP